MNTGAAPDTRLGIKVTFRVIDPTQFVSRLDERKFDMISLVLPYGLSPGNELTDDWGPEAADKNGSGNYGGVKDTALETEGRCPWRGGHRRVLSP